MLWCSHMFLINVHKVNSNQMTLIGFLFRQEKRFSSVQRFSEGHWNKWLECVIFIKSLQDNRYLHGLPVFFGTKLFQYKLIEWSCNTISRTKYLVQRTKNIHIKCVFWFTRKLAVIKSQKRFYRQQWRRDCEQRLETRIFQIKMLTLIETRLVITLPPPNNFKISDWHGYLMSWNGAFWWRSRKTWLRTLYSKGWFRRKLRRRPWSKFCIIENRQEPCCFLHSF